MQGSGEAFGSRAPAFRNVDLIDINSQTSSNSENIGINRAALIAATTAAGLLFLRVNRNSTAIAGLKAGSSVVGDDIEMRLNYHRKALGDLCLGLGLVVVKIQTLQTSTNDNSTAISTLEKTGNDVETRVNYLSHEGVGRPRFRARVSGCYSLNAPDEFRRTRCKHRRSASNTQ